MDEAQAPAPSAPKPAPQVKTKEERSRIAKEAATRRWAKAKREKEKAKRAKAAPKPPARKHAAAPREFSSALKTAEKRLAKAIQERAEHAAKYAVLSAEIPSLQRLIVALRNPLGAQYEVGTMAAPTLEQIVGDQPLTYQNPPVLRTAPSPPMQHPVTTQGRAMGGAIGVEIPDEENEDKFLETSGVAGGTWHAG